ncbi:hypothetical protein EN817_08620 [Mesorhizobium sp. M3A.F.Ca.ET.174.01.1.1]|uniref:AlbA family DNA-binding domain-containing protein n=1 Tax=unclassified Mesorhizobium TaxID=325217 RepID=UPI001093689D|nr:MULTISPECIES: RNA-binding domain-containing protein [unclassified Mesorhizobium]TGS87465.1 hypothetical protein EN818_08620 [Mesorhizobium sp. M3A.F.Ca.ET.175.01.1.1]TGT27925.1 hypothetical protein EN817_08620 [Mesorhizobium sp. M3A.F.Ca.ET.174.01.1.1]
MSNAERRKLPGGTKELFASFLKEPSRENFRKFFTESLGESRDLDYKREWPKGPILARHLLGIGNTGPGCLIVGVEENKNGTAEPVGLDELTDKMKVIDGLKNFIPDALRDRISIHDLDFGASEYEKLQGKLFQIVIVDFSVEHIHSWREKPARGYAKELYTSE